ncbi:MAG: TetR/AcrR family transcriptional regulator [Deltaproteobacteria bacterium]|nr:TetR/AcrR family transcriptional regulator [Deltaproteobacteria bacterium]
MPGRPPHIRDDDILDAARDVFRERGFATTTAEIARHAGISEGSIYYRFKTKEALVAALIDRETQPPKVLGELAARAGQGSLEANLTCLVSAVLGSVERGHPFFELLDASPMSFRVHALLRSHAHPPPTEIVALVGAYLRAEEALGRVRPVAHAVVGHAIFGACVDRVRSRRIGRHAPDDTAFVAGFVDLLYSGLAPPTASVRSESP